MHSHDETPSRHAAGTAKEDPEKYGIGSTENFFGLEMALFPLENFIPVLPVGKVGKKGGGKSRIIPHT